jgi:predicted RNase H-like nuclease (RuvC/YqgF family)
MAHKETYDSVRKAIIRIEKGRPKIVDAKRKMSVAAVAEESEVSRALIHRDMPDLLERIKGGVNKAVRVARDAKHEELKACRERNKELRDENEQLKEQLRHMQSINATLMLQNECLTKYPNDNSNIHPFSGK